MKISYFAETDTLLISFREGLSNESEEVAPDFVLDYGPEGGVISLEVEHASRHIELDGVSIQDLILKS